MTGISNYTALRQHRRHSLISRLQRPERHWVCYAGRLGPTVTINQEVAIGGKHQAKGLGIYLYLRYI